MRDYDALLKAGNTAQLEKLKKNGHKCDFADRSIGYLTNRIDDELNELFAEMVINPLEGLDYRAIRHEAADIANFAHMIVLACDKELLCNS